MTDNVNLDELLADPEKSQKKEELDKLILQLEYIRDADVRDLFDDTGRLISPKSWPDNIAFAVYRITPHGASGSYNVQFADKNKAIDTLAKITGAFSSDDENINPLEKAFSRIPREELVEMAQQLKAMGDIKVGDDSDKDEPDEQELAEQPV